MDCMAIAVTDTCSIACSASASPGSGSAPLQVFFSGGGETDHCTEDLRHSWTYSASADDAVCTKTGVVTVAEAPPCSVTCSAEASAAAGTAPLAVSFSSTASAAGCDSAVVSLWDFGDGSVSTQENPSHSYGQAGTYAWTFLAEANGVTCSESGSVVVEPPSCVLQCSASGLPAAGEAPHTVHFTSTLDASGCDGEVTTLWVFGDGATALDASPEHEYTAAGAYDWTFTAEVQGQTCTASGTVTVTEACVLQCDASAAADALTVSFTAQVDASGCPEPPETTWDFGDGATGSGLTAEHAYAQPGAYAWALTAEAGGVTCSREGTVVVTAPCALTCSASADPGAGAAPLSVQFSASAQGENCTGSQAFSWDFGDGTAGSGAGPTHVYAFPGTYDWSVTASLDGATCVSGGTVTAEEGVPGDLDGDGAVSVGEIQAVINMFLEGGTVDPGADCDGDGAISLGELQNVINCFLGLPCGC